MLDFFHQIGWYLVLLWCQKLGAVNNQGPKDINKWGFPTGSHFAAWPLRLWPCLGRELNHWHWQRLVGVKLSSPNGHFSRKHYAIGFWILYFPLFSNKPNSNQLSISSNFYLPPAQHGARMPHGPWPRQCQGLPAAGKNIPHHGWMAGGSKLQIFESEKLRETMFFLSA